MRLTSSAGIVLPVGVSSRSAMGEGWTLPEGDIEVSGPNDRRVEVTDHHVWDFLICSNRFLSNEGKIVLEFHLR